MSENYQTKCLCTNTLKLPRVLFSISLIIYNEKADILLGFTDNAYEYFSKGNIKQKRKILEIISEEITYKDKNFNVKLKPIFQTIAENQYNLTQKFANNRTLGNGIIKGVEPNSTPNNRKNSLY